MSIMKILCMDLFCTKISLSFNYTFHELFEIPSYFIGKHQISLPSAATAKVGIRYFLLGMAALPKMGCVAKKEMLS